MTNESSTDETKVPIGKQGEEFARNYLIENGYTIVAMNYRFGRGEIDIIADKDGMLIFVEVKTKKFGDFGDPIGWVPKSKQRQIGTIARGADFFVPMKRTWGKRRLHALQSAGMVERSPVSD